MASPLRFRRGRHKYGNTRRCEMDGHKFDSLAEMRRYQELRLLEQADKIRDLSVHPVFPISHGGIKICKVELDFQYFDGNRTVYEDVKRERRDRDGKLKFSTDTRHSKIGRKLLQAFYGIDVEVIR